MIFNVMYFHSILGLRILVVISEKEVIVSLNSLLHLFVESKMLLIVEAVRLDSGDLQHGIVPRVEVLQ